LAYPHEVLGDAMTAERYPDLFRFFAGYFHEDWTVDDEPPDDVIERFIAAYPERNKLGQLADLIDAFTAEATDDQALEQTLFEELGCYYVPAADEQSARGWLQHVSSRLRAAT
jgi:hypothetical protein